MKISASFLSIKENLAEKITCLDNSNIDYIHVDVMDGKFVPNETMPKEKMVSLLKETTCPKDVHLMVEDPIPYIDCFKELNPIYITFHVELDKDIKKIIEYIKDTGIKVGLSVKPNTPLEKLYPYLSMVDLVLVMSVEPGKGGQSFIENSTSRIKQLREYQANNNLDFVIEVDGGINDKTIGYVNHQVDISVVGSFITNGDNYNEQIDKLKATL